MTARRGESGLSGILLVDKPHGLTSHDVVHRVRKATGERRVGHAGTLDPMATGLLVVLVGPATRLAPYLTAARKTYVARFEFGIETDTDDALGQVVRTAQVPDRVLDADAASAFVSALEGSHEQLPPAFSAIKRDGVTAYKAARAGTALELEPRTIEVVSASLLGVGEYPPSWELELAVSKGTYIRALARDVGRELGSAAHLSALRRTRSGALSVADAIALADLEALQAPCGVAERFFDPLAALELPVVRVRAEGATRVASGSALDAAAHCEDACPQSGPVAIARENTLLAVYVVGDGVLRAQTVIPGGVGGGVR